LWHADANRLLNEDTIRCEMRGLVPLAPGDVMLMVGLFPATNAENRGHWLRLVELLSSGKKLMKRYCVTTRVIAIHDEGYPEMPVPA